MAKRESLLWSLERAAQPPSYLLGTMHVRDQRVFRWMMQLRELLEPCDLLALEFDLEEASVPGLKGLLLLPEEHSLDRLLGLRSYGKLKRILRKAFGLELAAFRRLHPMVLKQAIDASILQENMPHTLDEALYRAARGLDLPVVGLESYAGQLELLGQLPIRQQVRDLERLAAQVSRYRRQINQLARLYEQGRLRDLYQAVRRGAGKHRRLLIDRRNEAMAGRLAELAAGQRVFAAVGAGHLPGHQGMLRLLKQRGFRVQAVVLG
jgi:hypothetical protein